MKNLVKNHRIVSMNLGRSIKHYSFCNLCLFTKLRGRLHENFISGSFDTWLFLKKFISPEMKFSCKRPLSCMFCQYSLNLWFHQLFCSTYTFQKTIVQYDKVNAKYRMWAHFFLIRYNTSLYGKYNSL